MKSPVVHIATSAGGHIELMAAVRSAFAGYRRVWVVQPSLRANVLAREGEDVVELPDYERRGGRVRFLGQLLTNILRAARIALRERPRVVVTPGAGAIVPFAVFARLLGARVIFIETTARVTAPSASGKVLSRLATRVLVQWPELLAAYPGATLCQPALLRSVGISRPLPGRGTFVGVGTMSQPFDRLLEVVDRAVGNGVLPDPVVAQGGCSAYRARHFDVREWLSPDAVTEAIARAEYVVCHAGSGLVSSALRAGRRPLVLPRLARCGEHYDDHQTQIVAKLAEMGLLVALDDEIRPEHLAAARAPLRAPSSWALEPHVEDALREELRAVGPPVDDGRADDIDWRATGASTSTQRRIA
jgi:UDP-N-acetylglucosamine--N-acetylmuramyl-(pentapeptide) pyrophosphoryl-undecaprenol N-acetylglucosamine transferase